MQTTAALEISLPGARSRSVGWVAPLFVTALGYAAAGQGAFYLPQAATLALLLVVAAAPGFVDAFRGRSLELLGFGLLGGGLVLSAAASGWPAAARLPALTLAIGLTGYATVRGLIRSGDRHDVLSIMSWLGAGTGLLCVLGVAFHLVPLALPATGLWRAASTITYANGAGLLLVLTAPAGLLLVRGRGGLAERLALYAALAGLGATLSRGALLAAIIGGVTALVVGGRRTLAGMLRPALGAAVALGGLIPSVLGKNPHPVPALAALAMGAMIAASRGRGERAPTSSRGRWTLAAMVLVVLLAGAAGLTGRAGVRFVASRVSVVGEARLPTWQATLAQAAEHPILGSGPGTFDLPFTRFAHNEYLQALAETGLVGLGMLLLGAACLATAGFRARPAPGRRTAWALAIGTCAAFLVHGSIDFVWHIPVVVLLAFTWMAIATTPDQGEET